MSWKKNISLFLACLASVLFSCTNETAIPAHIEGVPDPDEFPQGFLTLDMDLPSLHHIETRSTRAYGQEELWGTDEENHVDRVRLVLYGAQITGIDGDGNPTYDPSSQVVRYAFDFNIESEKDDVTVGGSTVYKIARYHQYYDDNGTRHVFPEGDSQWPAAQGKPHLYRTQRSPSDPSVEDPSGFITWARRVMIDDYQMLLILNPPSSEYVADTYADPDLDLYEVTTPGQPLEKIETAIDLLQSNLRNKARYGFAEDNYFLMTNHQGLVPVPKEKLMPTEQLANDNPVPVRVSRVVGKVTVSRNKEASGSDPAETTQILPAGASATDFRFDLDAANKKTFWVRKMTNIISTGGAKGVMETLQDAGLYDRFSLYAEDPNYGDVSSDKEENFSYLTDSHNTPQLRYYLTGETGGAQGDDFAYCLENTMDNAAPPYPLRFIDYSDMLTTVWISCRYAPPGLAAGTSYYVWKGTCITTSAMDGFIFDPASVPPSPSYSGLADAIQQAAQEAFDLQPGHSFKEYGIRYYYGGISYYPVMICHNENLSTDPSTNEPVPGYGYYGIVRNFHYEIFIKTINGPGLPTLEPEPEPGSGFLEFEILINAWQGRVQTTIPGNPAKPPVIPT